MISQIKHCLSKVIGISFQGPLPMEDIWEREGPFRKNVQCDYKNFLSNSIKVNLINLVRLEPTGNCSASPPAARSATWHASLHWGETPGRGEAKGPWAPPWALGLRKWGPVVMKWTSADRTRDAFRLSDSQERRVLGVCLTGLQRRTRSLSNDLS